MTRSTLIQVVRNEAGGARAYPLVEYDRRSECLCRAVASGLQGNLERTERALMELEEFERGERDKMEFGGNDQGIEVTQDGAVFYSAHIDKPWLNRYSLDEVRDALEDWRDLLRTPRE